MPLFSAPKSESFPRQWAQMSLDYKLMFVWQGCVMILFMTGGFLMGGSQAIMSVIAFQDGQTEHSIQ